MRLKKVEYSPSFFKALKKFPKSQLKFLDRQQKIFQENPFDPRLKTHKLKGELSQFYAFSISYHWRIVFHFKDKQAVVFDMIGTHEIYK